MPTILITEFMDVAAMPLFGDAVVEYAPQLYRDRHLLWQRIATVDALVVRNETVVDRDLLDRAPRLQVVGRLGVGLDNIDVAALHERDVELVVPRGANAISVAEHVLAALLAISRKVESHSERIRRGGWQRDVDGFELCGKRLAILGFGATGRALATRALALGMEIRVHDPLHSERFDGVTNVETPEDLVQDVDFLSLHVPETPKTHGMIDAEFLKHLPSHAILINTARGGIVDENALREALLEGRLRGAILDVRAEEPPRQPDDLGALQNVWSTPHIAGITRESQRRIAESVAIRVGEFLTERSEPSRKEG